MASLQGETTIDFAPYNWFVTQMYGGLNCHLAHHLWPNIASCHYAAMYRHLVSYSPPEFLIPKDVSILQLLASHFRFLRRMGTE